MKPFLFIVGCGRSGTTLLQAMLDSHPDLAIPGESHFIPALIRRRKVYERPNGFDVRRFEARLRANRRFQQWGLPAKKLGERLEGDSPSNLVEAIRSVYAAYADHVDKTQYGDKTPNYVLHMRLLAEFFPEARFIHVIRDGRDVALSFMQIKEWGPNRVGQAALYWRRRVSAGTEEGERLGPERYREVRYEELVQDPEGVLRDVCRFASLDFDDTMLTYHERADAIMSGHFGAHRHENVRRPPTRAAENWTTRMSEREQRIFEELAGDLLVNMGYPTEERAAAGLLSLRRAVRPVFVRGSNLMRQLRLLPLVIRTRRRRPVR